MCSRVKIPVKYILYLWPMYTPLTIHIIDCSPNRHQPLRKSLCSDSSSTRSVVRRDQSSNALSTILQLIMKIIFVHEKPPPLAQLTQLVPTSSFNLKTTSQSSTATEKSSLTTFRRVQQHDERCNSNEIKHSTLQCIHVLVHSIFWLSQHQYTSHRPF